MDLRRRSGELFPEFASSPFFRIVVPRPRLGGPFLERGSVQDGIRKSRGGEIADGLRSYQPKDRALTGGNFGLRSSRTWPGRARQVGTGFRRESSVLLQATALGQPFNATGEARVSPAMASIRCSSLPMSSSISSANEIRHPALPEAFDTFGSIFGCHKLLLDRIESLRGSKWPGGGPSLPRGRSEPRIAR